MTTAYTTRATLNDHIRLLARAIKYRHKLDPAEVRAVLANVHAGDTAIDLGAHKGAYAYWLAKRVGRSGRVICVEPQQNLAHRLAGVMASRPQITVEWAAITTTTGRGTLSLRPDGSSHGASIDGFSDRNVGRTVEVPTVSLDDLVRQHSLTRLDFIKCDVEGHEGPVFAAGIETIRRFKPIILVECEARNERCEHSGVSGLARTFEPQGYRIRYFKGGALAPLSDFDAARDQTYGQGEFCNNFLLDHPDHPAAY